MGSTYLCFHYIQLDVYCLCLYNRLFYKFIAVSPKRGTTNQTHIANARRFKLDLRAKDIVVNSRCYLSFIGIVNINIFAIMTQQYWSVGVSKYTQ